MRLCMVNDCAFVGRTLLKYLPSDVQAQHIMRTRGLFDKTFGITWKIAKSKADIYHIHYLLQDCYVASRLGKTPLVGHAHGTDVRKTLKHPFYGRIVRHNLKHCNKVLVGTPDIIEKVRSIREDAEYLPSAYDKECFYYQPPTNAENLNPLNVLIASDCNWNVKGTDVAVKALADVSLRDKLNVVFIKGGIDFDKTIALANGLGLHYTVNPRVRHEEMSKYYWSADVVVDRFALGSLGLVSIEAIACGRPVLTYVDERIPENDGFPCKGLKDERSIVSLLESMQNEEFRSDLWKKEWKFVGKYHDPEVVVDKLLRIYKELT